MPPTVTVLHFVRRRTVAAPSPIGQVRAAGFEGRVDVIMDGREGNPLRGLHALSEMPVATAPLDPMILPTVVGDTSGTNASLVMMDVGMHTGEDTRRFLAAGFRVIAIGANPALVEQASRTFADEISDGRLKIVGAAITHRRGPVSLAVADHTEWSTLDPSMVVRNEREAGATYQYVDVQGVTFADVLEEHGVPFYLKVDIEGLDMLCVRALHNRAQRPAYLSLETAATTNQASAEKTFDEIAQCWSLGYRRFRYVEQCSRHVTHTANDPVPTPGSWSGPPWLSVEKALVVSQALRVHHRLSGMGGQWRDTLPGRAYRHVRWRLGRPPTWYDLQVAL